MDIRLDTRLESLRRRRRAAHRRRRVRRPTRSSGRPGVKPTPMLAATDLPRDERGRVDVRADAAGRAGMPDGAGRAGDCAAVPDLTRTSPARPRAPSAQHAVRQAKRLADNIVAVLARRASRCPTGTSTSGSVASLGPAQGRRPGLRRQAQGLAGLVHAPDVPHEPGPDLQPQGPGGRRLDAGAVLPPRGRLARPAAGPAPGVRVRREHRPRRPAAPGLRPAAPSARAESA